MAPAYSFRPAWTSRVLHSSRTAWIILGVSLVLTAIAWHLSNRYVVARAGERFNYRSEDVEKAIATRMTNYEQVLRSGVALFNSGGEPSREQWRRFVASLDLERNYPGIQGVGYSKVIPANGRAAHVAAVRAEGYPGYSMRPDGDREIYTSIVYLEPFVARNLRAFGFDMYSEATRRAAMSRARDGGAAAISGGVTLVQEDGKDPQKGFLMYLPVYRNGAAPATEAERREALLGWVYAPFRIKDLMHGILGNNYDDIDFTIHDGVIAKEDALLYSSVPPSVTPRPFDSEKDFTRALKLVTAGHTWTVTYVGRDFIAADDSLFSALVALGGVLIDVLLFLTIAQMSAQKREVEREVVARSAELRQRTADITALFELSPDGFVILRDARPGDRTSGLVEHVNPAFERLTGISADALVGRGAAELDDLLARRCLREADNATAADSDRLRLVVPEHRILQRGLLENETARFYYYRDITREAEVDRMKSEFLSTAAHELRTPMVSILGFTELLLERGFDEAMRREMLETVFRQTQLLVDMVNELLDLARIESRQGKDFRLTSQPLGPIVDAAVKSALPGSEVDRLRLVMPADACQVVADAEKTRQALVNVLANSRKYSAPGTPITVDLAEDGGPDGCIGIRVSDAGIGMTREQLARACERFYRADTSGNIPGSGLGLSLVKEIVALQNGRLDLASEFGVGTTVTIWLPRADALALERAA
ncbi:MAG: CHASE domain-containing protein [Burkholderiales bacterium]